MNLGRKNLSVIGGIGFIIILLISATYFYVSSSESNSKTEIKLSYIKSFENFAVGTKIEINYKDKNTNKLFSKTITITDNNHKLVLNNAVSNISYNIKNDKNYIDVTFTNNKISVSGLKTNNKVILTNNNQKITNAIPVDWAGRITLDKIPQSSNDLCLYLLNNKEQIICHKTTQQVAS